MRSLRMGKHLSQIASNDFSWLSAFRIICQCGECSRSIAPHSRQGVSSDQSMNGLYSVTFFCFRIHSLGGLVTIAVIVLSSRNTCREPSGSIREATRLNV